MDTGTLPKSMPNPSFSIILKKKIVSFIVNAIATSSTSMVDCAVSPCSSNLKLTGPFERNAR